MDDVQKFVILTIHHRHKPSEFTYYMLRVVDLTFNRIVTLLLPGLNRCIQLLQRPVLNLLAQGTSDVKVIKLQE
jgi:hypothetical protein